MEVYFWVLSARYPKNNHGLEEARCSRCVISDSSDGGGGNNNNNGVYFTSIYAIRLFI